MKFIPLNKHLLLGLIEEAKDGLVIVPEGTIVSSGEHEAYKFIDCSHDCDAVFKAMPPQGERVVMVNSNMVEQIKHGNETFHIILQNYVVGVMSNVDTE